MFREMRRKQQALTKEECREILERNTSGVLSLVNDDGYPYGVPLSYSYFGDTIVFHSAPEGEKMDAINRDDKASFCIIDQDEVHKEEYTTYYKSVICFGRIKVIEDPIAKEEAIVNLCEKFWPEDSFEHRESIIRPVIHRLAMLEFDIEHMSGKQAKKLMLAAK